MSRNNKNVGKNISIDVIFQITLFLYRIRYSYFPCEIQFFLLFESFGKCHCCIFLFYFNAVFDDPVFLFDKMTGIKLFSKLFSIKQLFVRKYFELFKN